MKNRSKYNINYISSNNKCNLFQNKKSYLYRNLKNLNNVISANDFTDIFNSNYF